MTRHGLTDHHLKILHDVLAPHAQDWDGVGLFGSRAAGTARPDSDIDLVIYGAGHASLVDRLFTLFGDSNLPMSVDVVDYDRITYAPLKAHIDAVMLPLFTRADIMQGTRARS